MRVLKCLLILVTFASLFLPAHGNDAGPVFVVEGFLDALSRADLDGMLVHVAEDATVFAPLTSSPQRIRGRAQISALFEPFFSSLEHEVDGPVRMNLVHRDLEVQLLGESAIVTFHLGQLPDLPLSETYSFSRRTFVLHIRNGEWKIVHLHASNVLIPAQAIE